MWVQTFSRASGKNILRQRSELERLHIRVRATLAQSGNIWVLVSRTTAGRVIPQKKELILPVNGDSNSIFLVYFKWELSVVNQVSQAPGEGV